VAPAPVDLAKDLDKLQGGGSWSTAARSRRGPSTSSQLSGPSPHVAPALIAVAGELDEQPSQRSSMPSPHPVPPRPATLSCTLTRATYSHRCLQDQQWLLAAMAGRERELSGEGDELLSYARAQDNIPINYSTLQEIYPVTILVPMQTWTNGYWSCGRSKCRPVL
jgi:hypothetical protein